MNNWISPRLVIAAVAVVLLPVFGNPWFGNLWTSALNSEVLQLKEWGHAASASKVPVSEVIHLCCSWLSPQPLQAHFGVCHAPPAAPEQWPHPHAIPQACSPQWCPAGPAPRCASFLLKDWRGRVFWSGCIISSIFFPPNITRWFNNNYMNFIINQTNTDIHLAYT